MLQAGWQARAAGWFTMPVAPGALGVITLSTATSHSAAGTGRSTAHVGLRINTVETLVCELTGKKDEGYRDRTATTSLGYLMPDKRWREWDVSGATATVVAQTMSEAVERFAVGHLTWLAKDVDALADAVRASAAWGQATGWARLVVLLATAGRVEQASTVLKERLREVTGRTDGAADDVRQVAERLSVWLPSVSV